MKKLLLAGLFILSAGHGQARAESASLQPREMRPDVAARYAIHAMASSNAYHNPDRPHFAIDKLGWTLVDLAGKPTSQPSQKRKSGLSYDVLEKRDSNEVIFAFRGTNSKKDYLTANFAIWPFSLQYTQAGQAFRQYMASHPDKKVTVTGHSLGGGLALSMSVRYGVDAVVFDSSPRIFDGLGDKHQPATRVLVYESGEILAVARKLWKKKLDDVILPENIYKATFDFGGASKHRSDYLAIGMVKLGATVDSTLQPVADALPK